MTDMDLGFGVYPDVFASKEVGAVADLLTHHPAGRSRAGTRHLMRDPEIRRFASDDRLVQVASAALGTTAAPFRATLFDKSTAANWLVAWHQDTALPLRRQVDAKGWGPWSVKAGILYAHAPADALATVVALRIHLDDSTATNGPLRVVPGTHTLGILTDDELIGLSRERQVVECLSPAGGVVAMRPLLVHASSKTLDSRRRRVLHIEYAARINFTNGLELAMA